MCSLYCHDTFILNLYLFIQQHYDHYNRKYGTTDPLTWDEYDDQVEKFKLEKIVPHMMAVEQEERQYPFYAMHLLIYAFELLRMNGFLDSG